MHLQNILQIGTLTSNKYTEQKRQHVQAAQLTLEVVRQEKCLSYTKVRAAHAKSVTCKAQEAKAQV